MANHKVFTAVLFVVLMATISWAEDPNWMVNVTVKDTDGKAVANFEAMAATPYTSNDWVKGQNGKAAVTDKIRTFYGRQLLDYQIIVRSSGFAPGIVGIKAEPGQTAQVDIVLTPVGYTMTITSEDGRNLPGDLQPMVILEPFLTRVLRGLADTRPESRAQWDFCMVHKKGDGQYAFSAPDEKVYVVVDQPGFLRGFVDGPYTIAAVKNGLTVTLPTPGQVSVSFGPGEGLNEAPYDTCSLYLYRIIPNLRTNTTLVTTSAKGASLNLSEDYYTPGDYTVNINTKPAERVERGVIHPGQFRDSDRFKVQAGEQNKVTLVYKPYSADFYKGDVKATLDIQMADGKAVTGESFVVTCRHPNYGDAQVAEGTLNETGRIVLEGLGANNYSVQVGREHDGNFTLKISGREKEVAQTFKFPPMAGNEAPDISLQEAFSDKIVKLSDFRGKVVFMDFWATWCGPCQGPMGHLNELWSQRKADWEGKVVLIGASVDKEKETLQKHIEKKDWNKIAQYWCYEKSDDAAFGAVAASTYGVTGVPTSLLIDQKGVIVWRGHPATINLEEEVAKLLGGN